MQFYSGFSLKNEVHFFDTFIKRSDYTIAGFSYGAIAALNAALNAVESSQRIDTLQLFSPAFFQTKNEKFKRLQTMAYKKSESTYMKQFISSCFSPYQVKDISHKETSIKELQELLYYEWSLDDLKKVESSGVKIEVYLGGEDKIIDSMSAKEFFLENTTVTYIKNANHFLQTN